MNVPPNVYRFLLSFDRCYVFGKKETSFFPICLINRCKREMEQNPLKTCYWRKLKLLPVIITFIIIIVIIVPGRLSFFSSLERTR